MSAGTTGRRIWRYFKRYAGDGLSPPVIAELPYGDPQSGRHHPANQEIWEWSDAIDATASASAASATAAEAARDLAQTYISDAVSQGEVPIYSSRAAIAAVELPDGLTACRVNGYGAAGDGGHALYKHADSEPSHPGKVQDDAGEWFEIAEQTVDIRMFGAVPGASATVNRQAFEAMVEFLATRLTGSNFREGVKGVGFGEFELDQTVTIADDGIQLEGFVLKAATGFTPASPLVDVTGEDVSLKDFTFNCNRISAGLKISNRQNVIENPVAYHFRGYGIEAGGDGGNMIVNAKVAQWLSGDAEAASNDNYDAIGLKVTANDQKIYGGIFRWCGVCVQFDAGANTTNVWNAHIYNGRSPGGIPAVNPKTIINNAGTHRFYSCYLGNGQIEDRVGGLTIGADCTIGTLPDKANHANGWTIGVFPDGANAKPNSFKIKGLFTGTSPYAANSGYSWSMVSFRPGLSGASWSGKFGAINEKMQIVRNVDLNVVNEALDVFTDDAGGPCKTYMTSGAALNFDYYIGASTAPSNADARVSVSAATYTVRSGVMRVRQPTGNTGYMFLGSADNGISNDGPALHLHSGGAMQVELDNSGNFRPIGTSQKIGTAAYPWSAAYFTSSPTITSDRRLKDVEPLTEAQIAAGLQLAAAITGYRLKSDGVWQAGWVAQDVEQICAAFDAGNLVTPGAPSTINPTGILALTVRALADNQARIEARLAALEAKG